MEITKQTNTTMSDQIHQKVEKPATDIQDAPDAGQKRRRRRKSEPSRYDLLCARSLLLWLIASGGTGLTM